MNVEEEFRSQNSGVRIKTLADSLTLRYQWGIQRKVRSWGAYYLVSQEEVLDRVTTF